MKQIYNFNAVFPKLDLNDLVGLQLKPLATMYATDPSNKFDLFDHQGTVLLIDGEFFSYDKDGNFICEVEYSMIARKLIEHKLAQTIDEI